MGPLFRCALGLALVASTTWPADAQGEHCTHDALTLDGSAIAATFCVAPTAGASGVSVSETFAGRGKTTTHSVTLSVVPGADVSRTIDDIDLSPLGFKRSLHMTLADRKGTVELEHALALPGATPVK